VKLWTARYSHRELGDEGYVPVRISRGAPRFRIAYRVRLQSFVELSPPSWLLAQSRAGEVGDEAFDGFYVAALESYGVGVIRGRLEAMDRGSAGNKGLVLLCFEDIRDFGVRCHRRCFASWWELRTGEVVEELPGDGKLHAKMDPPWSGPVLSAGR